MRRRSSPNLASALGTVFIRRATCSRTTTAQRNHHGHRPPYVGLLHRHPQLPHLPIEIRPVQP